MSVPSRRVPLLYILATTGLLTVSTTLAQTSVPSPPVGYLQLSCSASSDTIISVPFTQPAAFVGTVASISGSSITVSGSAGWVANQFLYSVSGTTFYAQLGPYSAGTDPKDGSMYTVTSNGTNSLTVNLNGDSLSTVPVGSAISVLPYWTLATVFPPSASGTSFIPSTSALIRQTQILIPNYTGSGVNLAAEAVYFFYNGAWRLAGDSITNSHNDDVLIPNGYFILRNPASGGTTLTQSGNVLTGNAITPLATLSSGQQDNAVGIIRPIDTALNNLGLITSGAFTVSTSALVRQDQLLVFNNSQTGVNKAASGVYFYYNSAWRLAGDTITNDHGTDVIPAGTGFIIRKATGTGATAFWQNPPTY